MGFSIKKWLSSFQKYFFYYRDGFYELPYIANSPELFVASFKGMPFVKSFPKKCYFTTDNLFLKGEGHYQKLEEGLWLTMSNFEVKKDLSFKLYYEPNMKSDYHFLSIYLSRGTKTVRLPKIHLDIECFDRSWTLFKAGSLCLNTHFKGQKSLFLTVFFTNDWMQQNIASNGVLKNKVLEDFFNSPHECLFLPSFLENKKEVYENLIYSFLNKDENGVKDLLLLKRNTLEIISSFVEKLDDNSTQKTFTNTSEKDKRKVIRAEYIISNAIFGEFPSIQAIAKEVGISETKLKSDFKEVFGTTMYNYYSIRQMTYAKEMLKKKDVAIKEIAFSLGFTNPSKFSVAFKKVHGYLPSEI